MALNVDNVARVGKELECPICLDLFKDPETLQCGHSFCKCCITQTMTKLRTCPICRKSIASARFSVPNSKLKNFVDLFQGLESEVRRKRKGYGGYRSPRREPRKTEFTIPSTIPSVPTNPFLGDDITQGDISFPSPPAANQTEALGLVGPPPTADVGKTSSSSDVDGKRKIILLSSLRSEELTDLDELAATSELRFGFGTESKKGEFTHVIARVNTENRALRTIKYLHGILYGKWIVRYEWLTESLKRGAWMAEEEYEVGGDRVTLGGPRKGRTTAQQTPPFSNCFFYFYGKFGLITKASLWSFVKCGGGSVINNLKELEACLASQDQDLGGGSCVRAIVDSETTFHVPDSLRRFSRLLVVDKNYILDSISNCELMDAGQYLLGMATNE